jgi:hypothetical protein
MFFNRQKLFFKLSDEKDGLSLAEALAGAVGTVNLGKNGVNLWTPNSKIPPSGEIICDLRFEAISDAVYSKFKDAAEGRFLPAHAVLFKGVHPAKIKHALEFFDYVIVPNKKIKNLPKDFRRRVLSYEAIELEEY